MGGHLGCGGSAAFVCHHLWDRDEFVFLILVAGEQMVRGYDCLCAVCAHLLVTSVVEKDYAASANLLNYLSFYFGCGQGVPVVTGDIPHDCIEA